MARTISVRVVTNEGQAIIDDAVSVRAPGELGYIGFLYNHAPLVTTLAPGRLSWRRPNGEQRTVLIGRGLLEITHNRFILLTDSISETSSAAT